MAKLITFVDRLANWRGIGILLILYALVFGAIVLTLSQLTTLTGGIGILDFDRGYTLERVQEVFDSYGEAGFALYGLIQLLDLFNPAIYSLLFACFIYLLWKGRKNIWVVLIPLAAGFLDYAENLTLYLLSASYPDLSPQLVSFSSTLSIIKNLVLFGAIAALLIGLIFWIRQRLSTKQN